MDLRKRVAIGCDIPTVGKLMRDYWLYEEKGGFLDRMLHSSTVTEVEQKFSRIYLVTTRNTLYLYYNQGLEAAGNVDESNAKIGIADKAPKAGRNITIKVFNGNITNPTDKKTFKVTQCDTIKEDVYVVCDGKDVYFVLVTQAK